MNDMNRRISLANGSMTGATAAIAVLCSAGVLAPVGFRRFPEIDAALEEVTASGAALGVVAQAATPDGVVYRGMAGKTNVETGAPMRDDIFGSSR